MEQPDWKIKVPSLKCIPEEFRPPHDAEERKEWWNGLSKKQKRVAVAYDVLHQLDLGIYNAKRGVYLDWNLKEDLENACEIENLVEVLNNQETRSQIETCQVCAIGSGVISALTLSNNTSYYDADPDGIVSSYEFDEDEETSPATEAFSSDEWRNLEGFFERWSRENPENAINMALNGSEKAKEKWIDRSMEDRPFSDEVALRAVFTSIIMNNGSTNQI